VVHARLHGREAWGAHQELGILGAPGPGKVVLLGRGPQHDLAWAQEAAQVGVQEAAQDGAAAGGPGPHRAGLPGGLACAQEAPLKPAQVDAQETPATPGLPRAGPLGPDRPRGLVGAQVPVQVAAQVAAHGSAVTAGSEPSNGYLVLDVCGRDRR
jgi:hypothetical protein